jgi:imidazolonepropionase-like amidohydrolase
LDVGTRSSNAEVAERTRAMQPRARDGLVRAVNAGVRIIAGTDMTSDRLTPTLADELAELVSVAAECLGVADDVGSIKPGLAADFVAVTSDPLADITAASVRAQPPTA